MLFVPRLQDVLSGSTANKCFSYVVSARECGEVLPAGFAVRASGCQWLSLVLAGRTHAHDVKPGFASTGSFDLAACVAKMRWRPDTSMGGKGRVNVPFEAMRNAGLRFRPSRLIFIPASVPVPGLGRRPREKSSSVGSAAIVRLAQPIAAFCFMTPCQSRPIRAEHRIAPSNHGATILRD